jgi:hypothetical protein
VVLLCTSILSTTAVATRLPLADMAGRLVVDVLSSRGPSCHQAPISV